MRDDAGSAGEIKRLAAFTLSQMLQNQRMPGGALLFRENFMSWRKVEGCGAAGPISLDFVSQAVVFTILDSVDH